MAIGCSICDQALPLKQMLTLNPFSNSSQLVEYVTIPNIKACVACSSDECGIMWMSIHDYNHLNSCPQHRKRANTKIWKLSFEILNWPISLDLCNNVTRVYLLTNHNRYQRFEKKGNLVCSLVKAIYSERQIHQTCLINKEKILLCKYRTGVGSSLLSLCIYSQTSHNPYLRWTQFPMGFWRLCGLRGHFVCKYWFGGPKFHGLWEVMGFEGMGYERFHCIWLL